MKIFETTCYVDTGDTLAVYVTDSKQAIVQTWNGHKKQEIVLPREEALRFASVLKARLTGAGLTEDAARTYFAWVEGTNITYRGASVQEAVDNLVRGSKVSSGEKMEVQVASGCPDLPQVTYTVRTSVTAVLEEKEDM